MAAPEGLPDEVKIFIVQSLACWDGPAVVAKAVKERWGLDLPRQNIHRYDASKKAGEELSDQLKAVFAETRKALLEERSEIGIAHRVVRLRALDRMATALEAVGNYKGAAAMLEQAAKEAGDAFTNTRKLDGNLRVDMVAQLLSEIDGDTRKPPIKE